ncbi:MAG: TetR family transcriptional regulator [Frondihabitans sp.]|nr:TetR family transcriptional regulator [Frondihabitans sp.]
MRERDTIELSISEIAARAGVSRQALYLHYRDRNQLLIDAAVGLFTREFIDGFEVPGQSMLDDTVLLTRHFDTNRDFYGVLLGGPCTYELNRQLFLLLQPFNAEAVRFLLGPDVDDDLVASLSEFLTGGFGQLINSWVVSRDPERLGSEEFARHLTRVLGALAHSHN